MGKPRFVDFVDWQAMYAGIVAKCFENHAEKRKSKDEDSKVAAPLLAHEAEAGAATGFVPPGSESPLPETGDAKTRARAKRALTTSRALSDDCYDHWDSVYNRMTQCVEHYEGRARFCAHVKLFHLASTSLRPRFDLASTTLRVRFMSKRFETSK